MKFYHYAFIGLISLFLLLSCETDFETNAEWKDITVVYGLLDQRDSMQYIKINKAFLGEGDALTFAKENDSINYSFPLKVWIEEWNDLGQKVQVIEFDTSHTYKPDDPDAVFPTGSQLIYKGGPASHYEIRYIVNPPFDTVGFEKIWFNDKSTYKLFIQYPDSSKLVTSETYLVKNFKIKKPIPGSTSINFAPNPSFPMQFEWEKAPNDDNKFRYEFLMVFNYSELTFDNQLNYKKLTLVKGEVFPQGGSSSLYFYYWSNNFYTSCLNNILYKDPSTEANIKERYTGNVEIKIAVAASEFNLFMQVYEPSTSIVQEKPPYTNIENGIGIYSSRYHNWLTKLLHDETKASLINYYELKFKN